LSLLTAAQPSSSSSHIRVTHRIPLSRSSWQRSPPALDAFPSPDHPYYSLYRSAPKTHTRREGSCNLLELISHGRSTTKCRDHFVIDSVWHAWRPLRQLFTLKEAAVPLSSTLARYRIKAHLTNPGNKVLFRFATLETVFQISFA
jgi:hypothetical protein